MMEIVLRKLKGTHSIKYRALRLESLRNSPESFGASYEEESTFAKLQFEISIEEGSTESFMFGAFVSEELTGICGFMRDNQRKTRHKGTIVQAYVKSAFQNRGIGKGLVKAVVNEAFSIQEIEQVTLSVVTNNKSAIKIYEQLGFEEYGLQKQYFKDGNNYYEQKLMILYK